MGDVTLRAKDQLKIDLVLRLVNGKITSDQVAKLLQISERSVRRLVRKYRDKGIYSLIHGNRGRKPSNRLSEGICEKVKELVKERYFDFNMTHALEKINEDTGFKIKRETMRKWCHEIGYVKKKKRRRGRPHYRRERMPQAGLLVQMDGSHHRWFSDEKTCLIAAIDDATGELLYAEIFKSENSPACLKVLRTVIERFGIFEALYVDRAGVFGNSKRKNFTQVARALSELGTQTLYAKSPEAKGRVERLFNTLQDRLIPEMRIAGIKSCETANHFLQTHFIPEFNRRFAVCAVKAEKAFKPLPKHINLDEVFCVKEYRTIARDHTISINGVTYMIGERFRYSLAKYRLELRERTDGQYSAYVHGRAVKLIQVERSKKLAA